MSKVTLKTGPPNNEMIKCEGRGATKKAAKQNAAEAMLVRLGYQSRQSANLKPVLKNSNSGGELQALVSASSTFVDVATAIAGVEDGADKDADKNEKRVKFMESDLVVTLDPVADPIGNRVEVISFGIDL